MLINWLFFALVVGYILRSVFLNLSGHWIGWISSHFIRIELELILWVVLDTFTLVPILMMHHLNFKKRRTEKIARQSFAPSRLTDSIRETEIRNSTVSEELNDSVNNTLD